jgi:hypothetical protein
MTRTRSVAVIVLLTAATLRADVQPGDTVGPENATVAADLVSPGILWCLQNGLRMKIIAPRKIEWGRAYREATEHYAGQVQLAPDGRSIVGHVAGLPFPTIDPNDPNVALKIMFNYEYKPFVTDDLDLRNFDADTGPITDTGMQIERHYLLDHLRTLSYVARLYVDPKPVIPNKEGIRGKGSLHPILEPFDLKGTGMTSIRYLDPDRQDDTWLYLAAMRRVRRLSSAQRSDALFAQDTDVDSYGGYAGQIPWFDWKYLGEKTILASFHAETFPVRYCEGRGDFVFCDNWEKRDVWMVEGVSKYPQYAYGKRLLFIDKETYLIAYSDIFDRGGQLWKVWINNFGFRPRAAPTYGIEYPDEMPFNHSISMVDIQMTHATRAALPSAKFPGEQGWYYNQGEKTGLTPEFFTIAHLIASGD